MSDTVSTTVLDETRPGRPDFIYAVLLLVAAGVAIAVAAPDAGLLAGEHGWATALFFLVFGLFTIATGFPHPVFGHVSFDRVAQVASILVLGPVDAAWINGLASLIYPWQRLRQGVPLPSVVMASMHNAGLMALVILGCGLAYQSLGGPIPLAALDLRIGALLLLLIVGMQIANDVGMMVTLYLRNSDPLAVFNRFTAVVEFVSAAAGILLAMAYIQQSMQFFILLMLVLAAGMLVIMQYALMRYRLEKIVDNRTRELKDQAVEFERQATHDKLTGLPNRRYADDYLEQQIELALRNDHTGAVALADIDFFKQINDRYSHSIGDRVLKRIAEILSDGCRKSDFVARYGGEEFLLCFPQTSPDEARQVCSQLRRDIQNADWSDIQSNLAVTISFGLAEIHSGSRRRTVLNDADMRLYRAKRAGRNRVIAA